MINIQSASVKKHTQIKKVQLLKSTLTLWCTMHLSLVLVAQHLVMSYTQMKITKIEQMNVSTRSEYADLEI